MTPSAELALDAEWTVRVLVQFIAREVRRTGRSRLVVGLSGGIDSAVAAFLAARALGASALGCVMLPHRASQPSSLADARAVVEALGAPSEVVDITPIVDGFERAAGGALDARRRGNAMARARMIVLYDRSARDEALVLGTSNKTELLLGYGTLHGDLASAINPLGDLYKTQVRELARFLELPASILAKPPSADLWPDQTDEQELGFRYDEVDPLLARLVDGRADRAAALAAGFPAALVDRVTRMIVRSQFKRRPAVIAKVAARSIGWDFRYPRDWMT